jgi:hypothetical protein
LVPQNVKADGPISIDVGVINLRGEADFRRLERIIRREGNREEEDATGVRGITLMTQAVSLLESESGTEGKGLTGPMIVACHWNILSPVGPAEQDDGGSRPRSINSYRKKNLSTMSEGRRYHCGVSEISGRAVASPTGRF